MRMPRRLRPLVQLMAAPAIGAALALLVGGLTGAVLGAGAWWACHRLLRADPQRAERTVVERLAPQWPWTLDLIAAGLRSGAPFPQAASTVAGAEGGELGRRLERFAQSLRLGSGAGEAVTALGRLPGAERLARQIDRSARSGAALAAGIEQLACSLRSERRVLTEERASRAAVALIGPLCLCFLPAFVAAGIGPVVFAIVADTVTGIGP
jgi:Flp pilus assembly protein TadB